MINRRHLRIKVLQALYATHQSGYMDVYEGKKALMKRLERLYDLTIWQMSFMIELRQFAEQYAEEARNKHIPTKEDLNPNTKFIDNVLLKQWEVNKELQDRIEAEKISWHTETSMIRKLFLQLKTEDFFIDYMQLPFNSYKADKDIVQQIFELLVMPHESLHAFFAEKDISWADDFNLSAELLIIMITEFKKSWDENKPLPRLFKDESEYNPKGQDRAFALDLYGLCVSNASNYDEMIKPKVNNWEMDRIAAIDRLLIHMSLTEIIYMPTIPLKVSLNEYIELSKYFSTPKSKVFINGLLDKLIKELKANNVIKKEGRGLVE